MTDLNYKLHSNGWTTFIDENLNELNNEQVLQIAKLVVKNMVVVFRNQKLSVEQQLNFCSKIGKVQSTVSDRTKHISIADGVLRVTAKKNEYGEEGLFGHRAALDWHANQPSNPQRKPLIWLYAAEETKNSRTSWLNNFQSFQDLDDDFKQQLRKIKIYCGYEKGLYSTSDFFNVHKNFENPIDLVQKNEEGLEGLFFPFLQIFGFQDHSDTEFNSIMNRLKAHVLNEKYMYHHDWNDHDIVISEQKLSIHKRWECDFMEKRVLHRIAFDHSQLYV